jgi:hypothetical protein
MIYFQITADTDMVVSPEQEFFLYELESSDSGSIGLVLR